jgi:predicted transcriptional regulator YdeE
MTETKAKALRKDQEALGPMVKREQILLIGISAPTDNQKEMSGQGVIPAMWQRFLQEGLLEKIPNRVDPSELTAAYHSIESDDRGPYSFLLGARVSGLSEVPEGMVGITVPGGDFLEVTTERGAFQTIGLAAWQRVWASEPIREFRRFEADLEVYSLTDMAQDNSQFKIYVGLETE